MIHQRRTVHCPRGWLGKNVREIKMVYSGPLNGPTEKLVHAVIWRSLVWILMMPQDSAVLPSREGEVAYSLSHVNYSDTSHSWVSVSSCIRIAFFLFYCLTCCMHSNLKRCGRLASHASKETHDSRHPPFLAAVMWWGELSGRWKLAVTKIKKKIRGGWILKSWVIKCRNLVVGVFFFAICRNPVTVTFDEFCPVPTHTYFGDSYGLFFVHFFFERFVTVSETYIGMKC